MTEKRIYRALAEAFVAEGVDTLFVLTGDGNMHWEAALERGRRLPELSRSPRALRLRHGERLCREKARSAWHR
jgi:hypothetical protein